MPGGDLFCASMLACQQSLWYMCLQTSRQTCSLCVNSEPQIVHCSSVPSKKCGTGSASAGGLAATGAGSPRGEAGAGVVAAKRCCVAMTAATISSIDILAECGGVFSLCNGPGPGCGNGSLLEPAIEAGGQMPVAVAAACNAASVCWSCRCCRTWANNLCVSMRRSIGDETIGVAVPDSVLTCAQG